MSDLVVEWNRYEFKTSLCENCIDENSPGKDAFTQKFDELYHGVSKPSEPTAEIPDTADDFVAECKEAETEVVDDNSVDANTMQLEKENGKRKLQISEIGIAKLTFVTNEPSSRPQKSETTNGTNNQSRCHRYAVLPLGIQVNVSC